MISDDEADEYLDDDLDDDLDAPEPDAEGAADAHGANEALTSDPPPGESESAPRRHYHASLAEARRARRALRARLRRAVRELLPDHCSATGEALPLARTRAASVTLFLNRLLGLSLADQRALLSFFEWLWRRAVGAARRDGRMDEGVAWHVATTTPVGRTLAARVAVGGGEGGGGEGGGGEGGGGEGRSEGGEGAKRRRLANADVTRKNGQAPPASLTPTPERSLTHVPAEVSVAGPHASAGESTQPTPALLLSVAACQVCVHASVAIRMRFEIALRSHRIAI